MLCDHYPAYGVRLRTLDTNSACADPDVPVGALTSSGFAVRLWRSLP
jgi:hypothetical protein